MVADHAEVVLAVHAEVVLADHEEVVLAVHAGVVLIVVTVSAVLHAEAVLKVLIVVVGDVVTRNVRIETHLIPQLKMHLEWKSAEIPDAIARYQKPV